MADYNVDWASSGQPNHEHLPGKATIVVAEKTTDTSTSLVLTGEGLPHYGEIQQENFIRLLENFASDIPPANPTIGQLWYDTGARIASGQNAGRPLSALPKLKICSWVVPGSPNLTEWDEISSNGSVNFFSQEAEPVSGVVLDQSGGYVSNQLNLKPGDIWYKPTTGFFRICISVDNANKGVWKVLAGWNSGQTLPTAESSATNGENTPVLGQVFLQTDTNNFGKTLFVKTDKNTSRNNGWVKIFDEFNLPFFSGTEAELRAAALTVAPGFIWYDTASSLIKVCYQNSDSKYRFNTSTASNVVLWKSSTITVLIQDAEPDNNQKADGVIWVTETAPSIYRIYLNGDWRYIAQPSNAAPLTNIKGNAVAGTSVDYARADHRHKSSTVEELFNYVLPTGVTPETGDILRLNVTNGNKTWVHTKLVDYGTDILTYLRTNMKMRDLADVEDAIPGPGTVLVYDGTQYKSQLLSNLVGSALTLEGLSNVQDWVKPAVIPNQPWTEYTPDSIIVSPGRIGNSPALPITTPIWNRFKLHFNANFSATPNLYDNYIERQVEATLLRRIARIYHKYKPDLTVQEYKLFNPNQISDVLNTGILDMSTRFDTYLNDYNFGKYDEPYPRNDYTDTNAANADRSTGVKFIGDLMIQYGRKMIGDLNGDMVTFNVPFRTAFEETPFVVASVHSNASAVVGGWSPSKLAAAKCFATVFSTAKGGFQLSIQSSLDITGGLLTELFNFLDVAISELLTLGSWSPPNHDPEDISVVWIAIGRRTTKFGSTLLDPKNVNFSQANEATNTIKAYDAFKYILLTS